MKVAGVDVGSMTSKAVIMDDNEIVDFIVLPVQDTWRVEADKLLKSVLDKAGLSRGDLDFVVATAAVHDDWDGADDYLSEVSCAANGAIYYYPSARTVIDMGAESSLCTKFDETGIVLDYISNQKCASGTGLFLDVIAGILEMSVDEIGRLSIDSKKDIQMNMTCAVFAESEVVSLIHQGERREDILHALHKSIASRTEAMLKNIKFEEEVVFIGGVARNQGMAHAISKAIGAEVKVPSNPEIAVALGAAIEARELA